MKQITFYFDFISPYAYLAFKKLPEALTGISYGVVYQPVLFAGLLKHHGQLGPAEIAPKRDWTYRQVMWLAAKLGVPLQMPAGHPFNPLPLLRLALACGERAGDTNRYVCEFIFNHVWTSGADMSDAERFDAVVGELKPRHALQSDEVKNSLKANTDAAIKKHVFGVPTFEVDGKLFWGLDALPMLCDYLLGGVWFDGSGWQNASLIPIGAARRGA